MRKIFDKTDIPMDDLTGESERPTRPKGLQFAWHFGNIEER